MVLNERPSRERIGGSSLTPAPSSTWRARGSRSGARTNSSHPRSCVPKRCRPSTRPSSGARSARRLTRSARKPCPAVEALSRASVRPTYTPPLSSRHAQPQPPPPRSRRTVTARPGRVLGGGAGPPERHPRALMACSTGDLSHPPQQMSAGSDARPTSVRQGRRRARGFDSGVPAAHGSWKQIVGGLKNE